MKMFPTAIKRATRMRVESPRAELLKASTNITAVHARIIRMGAADSCCPQLISSNRFRSFSRSVMVFVLLVANVIGHQPHTEGDR